MLPSGNKRGDDLADCGENLFGRNFTHATVVNEAANRLVAWPALNFARGLDCRRKRIERRPMPGTGWAEDSDRRGFERGCDERKYRVAQILAGEIARCGIADNLFYEQFFFGAAYHPDAKSFGDEPAREHRICGCRPPFRWTDGAGRERDDRSRIAI